MEMTSIQTGNPDEGRADSTLLSPAFCKLCLCEISSAASSTLRSCGCVFCTPCLQQYVRLSIRESGGSPISCPDATCWGPGVLEDFEIASLAPGDQVQLYEKLKFERDVQLDPGKTFCPVVQCQTPCRLVPDPTGRAISVVCPACSTVFCSLCRGDWHDGHSCLDLQPLASSSDRRPSSTMTDPPIKQCPVCGVHIERDQGCAQMLCKSCKHTFCWYCLQNLDGDIFLRHYDSGPCKNKLGHSRVSVIWNRTQVVGVLVAVSLLVLVTSPLLLLLLPCALCCACKRCRRREIDREPNREDSAV